jgi:branched-chain amino acid transport system substrate-binding protein
LDGTLKSFRYRALLLIGVPAALAIFAARSEAQFLVREHSVLANEIKIGMSSAETGRAGVVGTEIREGSEAYVAKVNRGGGIAGRRLVLVAYDDRFEPVETVDNVERLIDHDKVFALLNFYGTSNCRAIVPMINDANIVMVGPISGSTTLQQPMQRLIFNTRATYTEEAELLVEHIVADLGCKNVALFRQDDSDGDAARGAVIEALRRHGLLLAGEGVYVRNSVNTMDALFYIAKAKPDAVIMFGSYKPCADFVHDAKQMGLDSAVFCTVSTVGTEPLIKYLGKDSEGVVISQVVPSPYDDSLPFVRDYQTDMRSIGSTNFTYMGLEGYLNSVVLVAGLQAAGKDLTEELLVASLENLMIDFKSFSIRFSQDTRQGNHQVFLTQVKQGRAMPVEKLEMSRSGK